MTKKRKRLIELSTKYRGIELHKKSKIAAGKSFSNILIEYENGNQSLNSIHDALRLSNDSFDDYIESVFAFRIEFVELLIELGMLSYYTDPAVSQILFEELNELYRKNGFAIPQ